MRALQLSHRSFQRNLKLTRILRMLETEKLCRYFPLRFVFVSTA